MKFDYLVKHNGIYYPAGTDVPIEETSGEGVKAPAVDVSGKVEEPTVEITEETPVVEETPEVVPETVEETRKYSEDDLNVPHAVLKTMARKEGFKVPNTMKSEQIKEMLRSL